MALKKVFLTKVYYAFGAQFVAIVLSLVLVLGLPKVISVEEYGYWQLFILYGSFIGLFLLGLSDGVYLLYGGKEFNDLDWAEIKSKVIFTLFVQSLFAAIIIIWFIGISLDKTRLLVFISSAIFLVIGNLITLLGFILLATDKIKEYSKAVFLEKGIFLFFLVILFFIHELTVYTIIGGFLISKLASLIYLSKFFTQIRKVKRLGLKPTFSLVKKDCIFGFTLMLSNLTDAGILGIGKFIIEDRWNIETFAKISLSLSAVFFFMVLITQVSLVLFPTLRKFSADQQSKTLKISIDFLSYLLLGCYIGYYPLIHILTGWLPQYANGLRFLIILMPICLYEGKMQIINKTYMKVLNKQNLLFLINICILGGCLISIMIAGYYYDSLEGVVYCILACIALRSIIVQVVLYRIYSIHSQGQIMNDLILSILFVLVTLTYSSWKALSIYCIAYGLFLLIERRKIKRIFRLALSS